MKQDIIEYAFMFEKLIPAECISTGLKGALDVGQEPLLNYFNDKIGIFVSLPNFLLSLFTKPFLNYYLILIENRKKFHTNSTTLLICTL